MVKIDVKLTKQGENTLLAMSNSQKWMSRAVLPQVTLWLGRRIERYAKRAAPVRTGAGRRSIGITSINNGHAIVSDLHMLVMEEGRKPGSRMPPVEPLKRWVRRVWGVRGRRQTDAAAFRLAISIARKGIKPRRFFEQAIERATVQEKAQLDREAGRIINRMLRIRARNPHA